MPGWTFHILTFGCKVNQYESQALREAWTDLGGKECADPAEAQVALVNSCAVTARGERDARNALYRLHRAAPAARRILTGCSACLAGPALAGGQTDGQTSGQTDGQTDGQTGTQLVHSIVPPRAKALLLRGPWDLPPATGPEALPPTASVPAFGEQGTPGGQGFAIRAFQRARPVLKVQDGCSHRCTYCIVPLVRGPAQSRPLPDILAEATGLLEAGHGEIMLSGINLHHYGRDWRISDAKAPDFWDMLRALDAHLAPRWAGRARLRISSLEPSQLTPRGLDILAHCRTVCPHAHLSLQHGSPAVLRRMGRGHTRVERLLHAVQQLRSLWPSMGLGADILMGFPGESEADVTATLDVVRRLGLTYAHVFPYSVRPGTAAAAFDGQVPHHLKLARAASVRSAVDAQKKLFWQRLLGLPELVVALDSPHGANTARARKGVEAHYAPCRLLHPPTPEAVQQGMVRARPVDMDEKSLLLTPLP